MGAYIGLSPGRHQAIILTNTGILLIGSLEINFSEILIKIHIFSFKKMHLKNMMIIWYSLSDYYPYVNQAWSVSQWPIIHVI